MAPDLYILKLDDEEYKNAPLQVRLLTDMIAHKAEQKFYCTCSHIVTDRCHEKYKGKSYKEWDKSELLSIDEFKKEWEAQLECYIALERVYKSVFDDLEEHEQLIEKIATQYSEIMLNKYGWRKENANESCN